MDEWTYEAFANRDDPIPVVSFDNTDDLSENVETGEGKVEKGKNLAKGIFSKSSGKEKAQKDRGKTEGHGTTMQDRLLERFVLAVLLSMQLVI